MDTFPKAGKRLAYFAAVTTLALVAAGCASGVAIRIAPGPGDEPTSNGATADNAQPSVPAAPAPRTLPQAVCAYLRCLRTCPCNQGADTKKNGEREGKKNPDRDKEGGNGKKSGEKKSGDEGKKNPNDKDKEPDKPKESGKEDERKKDDEKDKGEKKEEDKENAKDEEKEKPQWYSAHAQATVVTQVHDRFRSPYVGPNSLVPDESAATSETSTLFLAARLWEGGDLVFNPEIAGGRGFSGTMGIAGFPNGEITRVGVPDPTPYIARLFFRQTFGLGGEQEKVEDAPNQIAGTRDVDRITVSIGKLTATDVVDDNRYSHDPRTQFLPWSIIYNGAWDYPANVRGYSYGFAVDINRKDWAVRYGVFMEPEFANGAELDSRILKANGHMLEFERRYELCDHPGKLRLMAYLNNAHMGNYRRALAEMPVDPDITQTRAYRVKYGFCINLEQELTKNLGVFARLGWSDGHTETWAFTEIDQTAALGLLLNGACWCRPKDQVGLAGCINGLSPWHRDYLAAGGLGFILGDGRLNYGHEEILELYYNLEVIKGINVTADFQGVNHPAYNRDRGPVAIGSLRVHFEF